MRTAVAAALFLNAFLLFVLQPHVSRRLLPVLGGGAEVWTVCTVFFQLTLLAGYFLANLARRLPGGPALAAHVVLLAVALLAWPFQAGEGPPSSASPVAWTLRTLVTQVGLLFVAVSATSPLLQAAYARAAPDQDPYSLFAASNAGSLGGLLAYPLLIEPLLSLGAQARAWVTAAIVLIGLLAGTGFVLARRAGTAAPVRAGAEGPPVPLARRLRWLALAALPSVLLLSVTAQITTDIAPVPLLWMIPLGLYLGSFILVFSSGWRRSRWTWTAFAVVSLPTLLAFAFSPSHWWWIGVHLIVLWCGSVLCHGALVEDRPEPGRLTEFYLWLASGGALGGVLAGVVAPVVFATRAEYPLAIVAVSWLVGSSRDGIRHLGLNWRFGLAVAIVALFAGLGFATAPGAPPVTFVVFALVPALAAVLCWHVPRYFAAFSTITLLAIPLVYWLDQDSTRLRGRTFYSVHEIRDQHGYRILLHGTTIHGAQSIQAARRREPLSYYGPGSPVADVFRHRIGEGARVAVVGLGAGVILSYARPDSQWTVYEIDPAIAKLATDPSWFTYWSDAPVRPTLVIGDGRLRLREAPDASFDLVVLDAFASDSVPAHLLTREAMALYLLKLRPGGAVLLNVSNRYVDLAPVLAAVAEQSGLAAFSRLHDVEDPMMGTFGSRWVLVGAPETTSAPTSGWAAVRRMPFVHAWTDDYSNVLAVLRPLRWAWGLPATR